MRSSELAPLSSVEAHRPVAGHQGAGPSATLDKSHDYFAVYGKNPIPKRFWVSNRAGAGSVIQLGLPMTTANTVNTMEDIIRILREQPEIREAVRREILTEELLNLPRQVAEMAAILRDVLATLQQHTEAIAEIRGDVSVLKTDVSGLKTDVAELKTDVSELKTDMAEVKADVAELKTDMVEVKADVAELKTDMVEVKADVSELKTSVAELKGSDAIGAAERRYGFIAFELGLKARHLLDSADIAQFAAHKAASGFSPSDLDSFMNCDLMIFAESPTEGECYIVVQVSYTVDHSDIDRAISHSQMVTRFTGLPAYPVVAGMERAGVTERRLTSGTVHWHRMPRAAARPR